MGGQPVRVYTWDGIDNQWVWTDGVTGGVGGTPGPSDSASIPFGPGLPSVFSQDLDVGTLDVAAPIAVSGFGTLTGDINAGTIFTDNIVYTGGVTADVFVVGGGGDTITGTIVFSADSASFGELVLSGASIAPNVIDVVGGASVDASNSSTTASIEIDGYGDLEINQGTVTGTLISVNSGTIDVNSGGTLNATSFGVDAGPPNGPGTVTVNSGGVMTTDTAAISGAGLGTGSVVVDGGTWTSTGSLAVGLGLLGSGVGVLVVSNGGSVLAQGGADALGAGVLSGSTGSISISGSGSTLDVASGATATIGGAGTGTLVVSGGASASVGGDLIAGATAGASGGISVDGSGSSLDISLAGTAEIGNAGTGALSVSNGAEVDAAGGMTVGVSQGVSGSVSVTGAGSTLDDGGSGLVLGQAGTGALVVSGGSFDLLSGGITLGVSANANGFVTLDDTALMLLGSVDVGEAGYGTLKVLNSGSGGATLSAAGLTIGDQANAVGSITVDGSGSALDSPTVIIGNAGSGGIKVSGSAVVTTTGDVRTAAGGTGAQGTISLDTSGQWLIGGTLAIGQLGTAGMKVADGAVFSAGEVDLGVGTAAAGTLSIAGNTIGATVEPSVMYFGTALNVGVDGTGSIKFSGGATLENAGSSGGNITLGVSAGASGTISLSGTGDLLAGNQLAVGSGFGSTAASGLLSIGAAETVSVNGAYVAASGVVTMSGGDFIASSIGVDGTITGSGSIIGTLGIGAGSIVAPSGSLEITSPVGSLQPGFYIGDKGTLQFDSTIAAGAQIFMGGTKSILVIDDFPDYQNATIESFGPGEKILLPLLDANKGVVVGNELELEDKVVNNGTTVVNNGSTVVTGGTTITTVEGSLAFSGMDVLSALGFKVKDAVGTGTTITVGCFARGTRIRTSRGDAPVEELREGDLVWSVIGERYEPVRWIGYRQVKCRAHPQPGKVWPVVVSAGSFGPGLPLRDLVLSPDHAVYVNEVLVPVKHLVNGTTIRQVKADRITYYHVELPRHDVLLAEGLPAESYLDVGDRANFANGGPVVRMHIDLAHQWEAEGCAPLVVYGPELEGVRKVVAARENPGTPAPRRRSAARRV